MNYLTIILLRYACHKRLIASKSASKSKTRNLLCKDDNIRADSKLRHNFDTVKNIPSLGQDKSVNVTL